MHLHEKYSGNQHAQSLRRPHLECWDLHVGARLNILGRCTTLMQCNLLTGKWLEYQVTTRPPSHREMDATERAYAPRTGYSVALTDRPHVIRASG